MGHNTPLRSIDLDVMPTSRVFCLNDVLSHCYSVRLLLEYLVEDNKSPLCCKAVFPVLIVPFSSRFGLKTRAVSCWLSIVPNLDDVPAGISSVTARNSKAAE